jgi:hypothetical protein
VVCGVAVWLEERVWFTACEDPCVKSMGVDGACLIDNQHFLLHLRKCAEVLVEHTEWLSNLKQPGVLDLWPDRVRVNGKWEEPTDCKAYRPMLILERLQKEGFAVTEVIVAQRFPEVALRISCRTGAVLRRASLRQTCEDTVGSRVGRPCVRRSPPRWERDEGGTWGGMRSIR